jgi:hypothetical protein
MRSQALTVAMLLSGGLALASGVLGACSTVISVSPDAGPVSPPICLTNVEMQNGASCSAPDGYQCLVGFPCTDPPVGQQASCLCTNRKWACSYTTGEGGTIPVGSAPACVPNGVGMQGDCPKNESPGMACTVAGLICPYAGETCPGAGFPNTDVCQCVAGPDGGPADAGPLGPPVVHPQLQYACDRQLCDPTSDSSVPPPPDAGPPDVAPDVMDGGTDSKS